jgi:predicted DNA-binding transcriptional regulator AlpA
MLLTCREVCSTLKISKSLFYVMLKEDSTLRPTLYIGKSPRWRHNDVEAWINSQEQMQKLKAGS